MIVDRFPLGPITNFQCKSYLIVAECSYFRRIAGCCRPNLDPDGCGNLISPIGPQTCPWGALGPSITLQVLECLVPLGLRCHL